MEKLRLGFGDAFALIEFIKMSGAAPALDAARPGNPDALKAMVSHGVLSPL